MLPIIPRLVQVQANSRLCVRGCLQETGIVVFKMVSLSSSAAAPHRRHMEVR
jgi:hypothetical protein